MPAPEPSPQPDTFKKKDVIEILSHKKAYNACKQQMTSLFLYIKNYFFSIFQLALMYGLYLEIYDSC